MQAVAGDAARWGSTEHLLAALIDATQVGNYLTTRAHFKGKPAPPKPIQRPGSRDADRIGGGRSYTREQMRSILDNWGEGVVEIFEPKEVT